MIRKVRRERVKVTDKLKRRRNQSLKAAYGSRSKPRVTIMKGPTE